MTRTPKPGNCSSKISMSLSAGFTLSTNRFVNFGMALTVGLDDLRTALDNLSAGPNPFDLLQIKTVGQLGRFLPLLSTEARQAA
jgi:hypothetical protein